MPQVELYGKKTSKSAKRLIIDLFNRLNHEKPYVMKTITTIYKNDEIFKGNLRYPIDAPYRSFYKELTEKYVVDHNLDNIFFESGEAITGQYFFEYKYYEETNNFRVFNIPIEIEIDTIQSYIPMLHSMITGNKIDWEDARNKTEFINESLENSTKILLVFGKDILKSLEFGWLASFEIKSSKKKDRDLITRDIRKQELEIVNFTQGVLFTELEDVIIGFIQSQKQFEHTKSLIRDHKHTLKNFGLKGALNSLYHKIKDDYETMSIYNYVENLGLLHNYTTDILYNFGDSSSQLLLRKKGVNSYTSILEMIHSATKDYETKRIFYDDKISSHSLNIIDDVDLPKIFTVMLNLYSNSRNHGKGEFTIEILLSNKDNLEIVFKNRGIMLKSYVDYFLSNKPIATKGKVEGIKFIKESLNRLNHITKSCITDIDSTTITLIINQKL